MSRDESTYGSVRNRYDEWLEIQRNRPAPEQPLPQQRPYTPQPEHSDMGKTVFAAIGFGICAMLFLLAVWALVVAGQWAGLDRAGAATGYTLVGVFLLIASIGGSLATWNHNFRVLTRPGGHH